MSPGSDRTTESSSISSFIPKFHGWCGSGHSIHMAGQGIGGRLNGGLQEDTPGSVVQQPSHPLSDYPSSGSVTPSSPWPILASPRCALARVSSSQRACISILVEHALDSSLASGRGARSTRSLPLLPSFSAKRDVMIFSQSDSEDEDAPGIGAEGTERGKED